MRDWKGFLVFAYACVLVASVSFLSPIMSDGAQVSMITAVALLPVGVALTIYMVREARAYKQP